MLNVSGGMRHSFIDVYSLGLADNSAMASTHMKHQKGRTLGANMRTLSGFIQELKILDRYSSLTQQDIKLKIKV